MVLSTPPTVSVRAPAGGEVIQTAMEGQAGDGAAGGGHTASPIQAAGQAVIVADTDTDTSVVNPTRRPRSAF